jgi:hypothetical protein
MVSIVGTMFADVLHVVIGIPYIDTTLLYFILLAAVLFAILIILPLIGY